MFRHVLVATDGSNLSERAALQSVAFAKSIGAQLTAVIVSAPYRALPSGPARVKLTEDVYLEECGRHAAYALGVIREAAIPLPVDEVHIVDDPPHRAIIDTAHERDCDVICMGSHGYRGLSALVLGSETVNVLTQSRIPVLVWR